MNISRLLILVLTFFVLSLKMAYSSNDTITIATYNVENLFDLHLDSTEYDIYRPNNANWDTDSYYNKLENIAAVIVALDADILILTEIESKRSLNALHKRLRRRGKNYHFKTIGSTPNPTSVSCAMLSIFPLVNIKTYGVPRRGRFYTRNILETTAILGEDSLIIFAVHFSSKRNKESARIRATLVLKNRLEQLSPSDEYIIAGDFNSNHNEAEVFFTSQHDNTDGKTAINHILKTVSSNPMEPLVYVTEESIHANKNGCYHFDPWIEVKQEDRFSYIYKGSFETIDHILMPKTLFDSTGISYCDNTFCHFLFGGRLMRNGTVYRWQLGRNKYGRYHLGKGYSDHLPVIARFVKGAFELTNEVTKNIDPHNRNTGTISSFESGCEGWIVLSKNISLREKKYDSNNVALSCRGMTKKNATVLRCAVNLNHYKKINKENITRFSMKIRGSGAAVFRIRSSNKKWYYINPPLWNQTSSSARYLPFNIKKWQKISATLPTVIANDSVLVIELRTKGKVEQKILIDDVELNMNKL